MRSFQTTNQGLNHNSLPLRLYHKAKKLGIWDPKDIDLRQDQTDWSVMEESEKEKVLRLLAMFQAGEEAVTLDLLPLIGAIAKQGRLEEELFLTTFLFEEAKHTEFFRRFLDEVAGVTSDLSCYHTPSYRKIFYEALPQAMQALAVDQSPRAIAKASVTYNMIVEGVLAETGYYTFYETVSKQGLLPGLMKGIAYLKIDESRHIGYGTYLLQRLICENEGLWDFIYAELNSFVPTLTNFIQENFDPNNLPKGLNYDEFLSYSTQRLLSRIDVLERARTKTIDEIYRITEREVGVIEPTVV